MSGQQLFAAMNALSGVGHQVSDGQQFVSKAVTTAYFNSMRTCGSTVNVSTQRLLECQPPEGFARNEGCRRCREIVQEALLQRQATETLATELSGWQAPTEKSPPQLRLERGRLDPRSDPCRYHCTSCLSENNVQTSRLQVSISANGCEWDSIAATFQSELQRALQAQLGEAEPLLAELMPKSSIDTSLVRIRQDITRHMSVTLHQRVQQSLIQYQELQIAPGSHGVVVSGNTQSFDTRVLQDVMDKLLLQNRLYDETDLLVTYLALLDKMEIEGVMTILRRAIADFALAWDSVNLRMYVMLACAAACCIIVAAAFFSSSQLRT